MPPIFSREIQRPLISTTSLKFQTRTSPCEESCPAGNPIQKVHGLMKEKRYEEAIEYVRARNPFPATTGRICTHPCEKDCNRREWDQGVHIKALERAVTEMAERIRVKKPARMERSGKKVAVIGGGPAGLTFAYFSSLLGHEVTIFEAGPTLGGIPRLCVPEYRLSKDILDMEIGLVLETGVRARTNMRVGRDILFEEIRRSFDAVLIATGTWKERNLDIPNAGKALKGVEFLRHVVLGLIRSVGRRVIIVGGGGVAFDCAFTTRRLGAEEVHVVCLEGSECMVTPSDDLVQAREEGITIHNSCMVARVLEQNGVTAGIEYCDIETVSFDNSGEALIEPAGGERKTLPGDTVIFAAGVVPELAFIDGSGIALNPDGTIRAEGESMATSVEGVFAAGDVATGPSIVANAIGRGREAALAVHRFLTGLPKASDVLVIGDDLRIRVDSIGREEKTHVVRFGEMLNPDYYGKARRNASTTSEKNGGMDERSAVLESERCFHCGHCHKCGKCVEDCPGLILVMKEYGPEVAYADECWHCGNCRISCPDAAVAYEFPLYTLV